MTHEYNHYVTVDGKQFHSRGVLLPIPVKAKEMSMAKARIIGYLMGDGCVCEVNKGGGRNYPAPFVAFYNKDLSVIKQFITDCKEVYDVDAQYKPKKAEVRLYRKSIFIDLKRYGEYGTFDWSVPFDILNNVSYKKEWVKAFCDSEATVGVKRKDIVVYSANKKGLNQVCSILSELGISSRIYGFYAGAYRLRINGKDNLVKFHKNCTFYHLVKREKLSKIIGCS